MTTIHRRRLIAATATTLCATALLPGLVLAQKKIVLGFSQVGAESEWRTANTESIKSAANNNSAANTPADTSADAPATDGQEGCT